MRGLALLSIALLLAGCTAQSGATARIEGMAMKDDGSAYSYIQVTLNPGGKVTSTDGQGQFAFANLTAGTYTLHFQPNGGSGFDSQVMLADGQQKECMFMAGERC